MKTTVGVSAAGPARDLRARGKAHVQLCRKHPTLRPRSPLARMNRTTLVGRWVRRLAVRVPRLAGAAHYGAFLAGAALEAGSWERLEQEFGVRLPVLLYHHVGIPREGTWPSLTVSPERFEAHMAWLKGRGYVGIRSSDWLAWRQEGRPLPPRPVLLTFDDAYADTAEHAFPVLQRHGFGAAVFAVTARLGRVSTWDEPLGWTGQRLMTPEQVRHWAARGIEFGAHGRTHPDLRALDDRALEQEVLGSADDVEDLLGAPPVAFSYPYGLSDDRVRAAVRRRFRLAFTVELGLNDLGTDPYRLRRTTIEPSHSRVDLVCAVRSGGNRKTYLDRIGWPLASRKA